MAAKGARGGGPGDGFGAGGRVVLDWWRGSGTGVRLNVKSLEIIDALLEQVRFLFGPLLEGRDGGKMSIQWGRGRFVQPKMRSTVLVALGFSVFRGGPRSCRKSMGDRYSCSTSHHPLCFRPAIRSSVCGQDVGRHRLAQGVHRIFRSRRCVPPPTHGCGRHPGWWTGGGR